MSLDEAAEYRVREFPVPYVLAVDDCVGDNHRLEVPRLDAVPKLAEDVVLLLLRRQHPTFGVDEVIPHVSDSGLEERVGFADYPVVRGVGWQVYGNLNVLHHHFLLDDDLALNILFVLHDLEVRNRRLLQKVSEDAHKNRPPKSACSLPEVLVNVLSEAARVVAIDLGGAGHDVSDLLGLDHPTAALALDRGSVLGHVALGVDAEAHV